MQWKADASYANIMMLCFIFEGILHWLKPLYNSCAGFVYIAFTTLFIAAVVTALKNKDTRGDRGEEDAWNTLR